MSESWLCNLKDTGARETMLRSGLGDDDQGLANVRSKWVSRRVDVVAVGDDHDAYGSGVCNPSDGSRWPSTG